MEQFWADWGLLAYLAAAAWAFFEGETFVLLAAAAGRATGLIDPWALMISVWLGSCLGDQLWFYLGRRYGMRAIHRIPGAHRSMATAFKFLERFGTFFVLTYRFVYGIRNVSSVACGMAGMTWLRFSVLNFCGAGVWAASFVAAGWWIAAELGTTGVCELFGVVGLLAVSWMGWRHWRGRTTRRLAETQVP